MKKEEIKKLLESMGITMTWTQIPYSSYKALNPGDDWLSFRWVVTIVRGDKKIPAIQFGAGIGNASAYKQNLFKDNKNMLWHYKNWLEHGRPTHDMDPNQRARFKCFSEIESMKNAPDLIDIVDSLVRDRYAVDYAFEEWATEYGYGTDSRKAEKLYTLICDQSRLLSRMFSEAELQTLDEAFEDY